MVTAENSRRHSHFNSGGVTLLPGQVLINVTGMWPRKFPDSVGPNLGSGDSRGSFGKSPFLERIRNEMENDTETSPYYATSYKRTSASECGVNHKNGDTANASPNEDALPKWANDRSRHPQRIPSLCVCARD